MARASSQSACLQSSGAQDQPVALPLSRARAADGLLRRQCVHRRVTSDGAPPTTLAHN
eukprot:CAMPEP_0204554876 /NCGR_PEP_ID=MMETSP0661-20131031/28434_1 /ASSEMBLY_ACC=CAM_ASM_000606 /TAXON_ID=109239 /ORGANISM="Alexandrium margalefi, Strain AMGDE01CS-322" /LENGTH=57 /DNA_ID=CAMNT_0051561955 /DNA_START=20 /DNA_END=190 /DNA_ORIENTATION=-